MLILSDFKEATLFAIIIANRVDFLIPYNAICNNYFTQRF